MNLIADIGNTQYKICVFENNKLVLSEFHTSFSSSRLSSITEKYPIEKCIFSDTRGEAEQFRELLLQNNIRPTELDNTINTPLKILYDTPQTLGKDRIAAAVGAWSLFPESNILVIDIGTAITIDFVSSEGEYCGGIISPGPETRYRALYEFTGKLPLIEPHHVSNALAGKNTHDAISLGVQNGILFEINEYILRYNTQYKNLNVVLSGGYSYLFDNKIKYPIFAELFLVPLGLNVILNYNDIKKK